MYDPLNVQTFSNSLSWAIFHHDIGNKVSEEGDDEEYVLCQNGFDWKFLKDMRVLFSLFVVITAFRLIEFAFYRHV